MKNFLKIIPEKNQAKILLGGEYETIDLLTTDWSIKQYLQQWKGAIAHLLKTKDIVCLIKSYESASNCVAKIHIYTIFPKALAYPLYENPDNDVFYITESFIFITENAELLKSNYYFDKIFDSYGSYFPIYYFDPNQIERFYLYLSPILNGISSWQVSKEALCTVFSL